MSRVSWSLGRGDINGLLGVLLDNVAALALLYTLLAAPGYRVDRFAPSFVLTWLVPGTVTGVLVGGLAYAILARRLMRRTGKKDVTAMPVGLDTPSVFAMSMFVLVPALAEGRQLFAGRHLDEFELRHLASIYAWHVSALVLLVQGVCKIVLAPFGRMLHRLLPRAALLGSMAAVALPRSSLLPSALRRHRPGARHRPARACRRAGDTTWASRQLTGSAWLGPGTGIGLAHRRDEHRPW